MCAYLVWVEAECLEANLGSMEAQEGGDLSAVDGLRGVVGVVGAYGSVWRGVVAAEVEVTVGSSHNWVTKVVPSCFHGGGFAPDGVLLGVKEECDRPGGEEYSVRGVMRNDAPCIVELHVPVTELYSPAVRGCLGIFARTEAEEKCDLDEVGHALGQG